MINFIWLGDPMPHHYTQFINEWQRLNLEHEVKVWGEEEIFDNLNRWHNKAVLEQMRHESGQEGADLRAYWTHVADVVDYELVLQYGGWYFNVDMKPLKPLSVLGERFDLTLPGLAMEDDFWPVNMAMYSPLPYNSLYLRIVERLGPRYFENPGAFMNFTTGTHLLKEVVDSYNGHINLFPRSTFNPIHWSEFDYGSEPDYNNIRYPEEAVATHLWRHRTTQRNQRILET